MRFRIVLASVALWLLCLCAGAACASPNEPNTMFLNGSESFISARAHTRAFTFTPAQTGHYIICGFPATLSQNGGVYVRVRDEAGAVIASASGGGAFHLEVTLIQNQTFAIELSSSCDTLSLRVEIMADSFGHCFDRPILLSGHSVRYNRAIVRPRDTHWYAFTAALDGWYVIRSETEALAPDMRGALFDESGILLAENDDILFPHDGNFRICRHLSAGHTYYVRVCAASNQTGGYHLVVASPESGPRLPAYATLSEAALTLEVGESAPLTLSWQPEDTQSDITWLSEDRAVATVSPDGIVTAISDGRTIIHAYIGRLELVCEVNVPAIPITALSLSEADITLAVGETIRLSPLIWPANASTQALLWACSDPDVARIDQTGLLTALAEGQAELTLTDGLTALQTTARITVTAPKPVYRALVLGEMNYETGRVRLGGLNTAQGVADMLSRQAMGGQPYEVCLKIDSTREEMLAAIQTTFADARENDISLFYINCHGNYDDQAWLELHDGSRITAVQLEQVLRAIPGRVVVIIDCCRSGGFLGGAADFAQAAQAAFERSPLACGKYIVLTSAGPDEDSYRRSFSDGSDEDSMATIMARALCEGAGWDLIGDRLCALKADLNKDKCITAEEIYLYLSRRVLFYLDGTGVTQTVCLWPQGDQTVLFQSARGAA